MATTWVTVGGSNNRTYLNSAFVESLVVEQNNMIGFTVRISTISGKEYLAFFSEEEARDAFVTAWSGDMKHLDLEPVIQLVSADEEL
jgi:hypothetical protein